MIGTVFHLDNFTKRFPGSVKQIDFFAESVRK